MQKIVMKKTGWIVSMECNLMGQVHGLLVISFLGMLWFLLVLIFIFFNNPLFHAEQKKVNVNFS